VCAHTAAAMFGRETCVWKLGQEPRARPRGIRSLSEMLPGQLSPPEAHAILLSWGAGNKLAKGKRGQQERPQPPVPSVPHLHPPRIFHSSPRDENMAANESAPPDSRANSLALHTTSHAVAVQSKPGDSMQEVLSR
jgi:hypothetical protein